MRSSLDRLPRPGRGCRAGSTPIELAKHAAHHAVSDHSAGAQVEERLFLCPDHGVAHASIFGGTALVEDAAVVRRRCEHVVMTAMFGRVQPQARFAARPSTRPLPVALAQIPHHFGMRRVGEPGRIEDPQSRLCGSEPRVGFLVLRAAVCRQTEEAREGSERRPLYDEGGEDYGEADEEDLRPRGEGRARSDGEGQRQRNSENRRRGSPPTPRRTRIARRAAAGDRRG